LRVVRPGHADHDLMRADIRPGGMVVNSG
jgi:hypothetical protein